MNQKRLVKNYLLNLTYQILSFIIPLMTTPYISRVLTEIEIGQYGYTHSVVTYFVLFGSMGMNLYGQREIAYQQQNVISQKKIFLELVQLRISAMSIVTLIYLMFIQLFPQYRILFYIQIFDLLASAVDISWFFQGREEFNKTVIVQSVVKVIGAVAIFSLVKSPKDVGLYVACLSVPLFLGNLFMWTYLPQIFIGVGTIKIERFRHLKTVWALFVPQIAIEVYTVLDKTMIGLITGLDSEVGYYEQAQKIVKTALVVVTSLGTVMLPRVSSVLKNEKDVNVFSMIYRSFRVAILLAVPIAFGLFSASRSLVIWFMGERYLHSAELIQIICPVIIFIGIASVTGNQFLVPMNMSKEYTYSVLIGASVNIFMNSFLIPRHAAVGASIATVMAEFVVTSFQLFFIRKKINLKKVYNESKKSIIAGIIMLIGTIGLNYLNIKPFFLLCIQVVIGGIIYFGVLLVLKDETVLNVLKKIRIKQRKR